MKRVLEVLAITLLVVGIELATGAVSHGLNELAGVLKHLVAGGEAQVSLPRFFVGMGMVLLGGGLLVLDLWVRAYARFMGRGRDCPHCGTKTERVKRRWVHRMVGWILGEKVTYRKCRKCGWHGLMGLF